MENQADNTQGEKTRSGFKAFATKRIIVAAVLIIAVVWALGIGLDIFGRPGPLPVDREMQQPRTTKEVMEHQEDTPATVSPVTHAAPSDASSGAQHAAAPQSEHAVAAAGQAETSGPHPGLFAPSIAGTVPSASFFSSC